MILLSYELMVGRGEREAATAEEAVSAYAQIKAAGASSIFIRDVDGRMVTYEELVVMAEDAGRLRRRTQRFDILAWLLGRG